MCFVLVIRFVFAVATKASSVARSLKLGLIDLA